MLCEMLTVEGKLVEARYEDFPLDELKIEHLFCLSEYSEA